MVKKAKAKKAKVEKVKKLAKAKASKVAKKTVKKAATKKGAKVEVARRKTNTKKVAKYRPVKAVKKTGAQSEPAAKKVVQRRPKSRPEAERKSRATQTVSPPAGPSTFATTVAFEDLHSTEALVASTRAAARDNASRIAVVYCVNAFMDARRPGWNADQQGDGRLLGAHYNFPPQSIPAPVLTDVCHRLNNYQPRYTFPITAALVNSCAAGDVANMKFEIYQVTSRI
jgi:hypothetical protein